MKKNKKKQPIAKTVDHHMLYEAAVQNVDYDLDLCERIYRKLRGKHCSLLKEDFCGTAALCCEWVNRHSENKAWGVDLCSDTLAWGKKHHVSYLGNNSKRLSLINDNVLNVTHPKVDMVVAFNFSCFIFKQREELLAYFRSAYKSLRKDGVFILDVFGGTGSMDEKHDKQNIAKTARPDGLKVPKFTYGWEQAKFNCINHHITCYIHFKFADGSKIKKAFTYDWRLWTLPELQELLYEAGFSSVDVYLHGWDKDGDSDETYRKRKHYDNAHGWVGYVAAGK